MRKKAKKTETPRIETEYRKYFRYKQNAKPSNLKKEEISLEQPPMFEYVPSYTTYSISEEAISR